MGFSIYRAVSLGIFLTCFTGIGSALRVDIQPQPFNFLTKQLNVSCIADEPAYMTKSILNIQIMRHIEDRPIASVTMRHMKMAVGMKDKVKAEGHIGVITNTSYLTLTINKPDRQDGGTYRCQMFFIDENFQMTEKNVIGNATYQESDISWVVRHLATKVSSLLTNDVTQNQTIKTLTKQHTAFDNIHSKNKLDMDILMDKIETLNKTVIQQNKDLEGLRNENSKHKEDMDRQKNINENLTKQINQLNKDKAEEEQQLHILTQYIAQQNETIQNLQLQFQNMAKNMVKVHDKAMVKHLKNVSDLEKKTKDLENTIKEQERQHLVQDTKVSSRIDQLEVTVQHWSKAIQGIIDKGSKKATPDHLPNKVLELEKDTQDLEETIKDQERQAAKESSRTDQLEGTVKALDKKVQGLVDKDDTFSAFSVYGTNEKYSSGNTLTFKHFMLNIGYDYYMPTGIYTAPKKGFYVFNLSAFAYSRRDLDLSLKVNGGIVSSLFVRNEYYHDQASVSAIVKLNKGDRVWPSVKDGNSFTNLNDKYTVFNGYLLRLL